MPQNPSDFEPADAAESTAAASTHFTTDGHAHMVDVTEKSVTARTATASARITMTDAAAQVIRQGTCKKGDVLSVARLAAISGSKWTSTLIPLCHVIPIEGVTVTFDWDPDVAGRACLRCDATVRTTAKTGVEMEALTAVTLGTLTVYDMMKSVDKSMEIQNVHLDAKQGGKSGDYHR